MSEEPRTCFDLHLNELVVGTPGITSAFGEGLAQAASVCLEDRGHTSPVAMTVHADQNAQATVNWDAANDQVRRCWNDDQEATEHGAYGIAALIIPRTMDLHVVERSKKGTGFDYWLGSLSNDGPLFQKKARLEVAGIRTGSRATVSRKLQQKLEQTKKSDGLFPAVVAVVEFGTPQTHLASRCST